ncbi:5-formyltetrahydrofolate cyclo-ligase [Corynebacterium kroppenstedtii]|uniref:5-formyltetrahydrofolate cyclo-ligase n=1 Tax=Corynebacterium sp. PCR 32 TaxID=3351342 RepID=UPI0030993230
MQESDALSLSNSGKINVADQKQNYRSQLRRQRRNLPENTLTTWDQQLITEIVTAMWRHAQASHSDSNSSHPLSIAAYVPINNEPGAHTPHGFIPQLLSALHDHVHSQIVIPRREPARKLSWHPWNPRALTTTSFGLIEPDEHSTPIPFETVTIALVPALAYDTRGHRLGQGGGFYDRALAPQHRATPLHTIGIVHPHEILPTVPHEYWDAQINTVVTASGCHELPST